MKAYLVGGGAGGTEEYNGVYHLVTADGVCWATQWCGDFTQARRDLYEDRAGLKEDWARKYGEVEVLRLGDDGMTFDHLLARELNYTPVPKGELADGVYYSIITVKNGVWDKSDPKPVQELGAILTDTLYKKYKK